jgi:Fic family protein
MDREELKRKFILDDAAIKNNLEEVVNTALHYCAVDASGRVYLKQHDLAGKARVKVVLSAKTIANQLDDSFSAEITVADLSKSTGLAENQARARASEAVDEGFAESTARGSYRANPFRVAQFLKGLAGVAKK